MKVYNGKFFNIRPMLLLAIFMILSVLFCSSFYQSSLITYSFLGVVSVLTFLSWLKRNLKFGVVCLAVIIIFCISYTMLNSDNLTKGNYKISGEVFKVINLNDNDNNSVVLKNIFVNDEKYSDKGLVYIQNSEIAVGDYITFKGLLIPSKVGKNVSPYLANNKIIDNKIGFSVVAENIIKLPDIKPSFQTFVRKKFISSIENAFSEKGIVLSLLYGERGYLDENTEEIFRAWGILHMLVVSGMHIVLLVALFTFLLKAFKLRKIIRLLLSFGFVSVYAWILGFPGSVVRAMVMTAVYYFAEMTFCNKDKLSALATAVVVILFINPMSLFSSGFQFSVLAVLGILSFYPIFSRFRPQKSKFALAIFDIVTVAISANVFLFPLLLSYGFPIFTILGALILAPVLSIIYSICVIICLTLLIFPFLKFVAIPIDICLFLVKSVSELIFCFPILYITADIGAVFSIIYYILAVFLSKFCKKEKMFKV